MQSRCVLDKSSSNRCFSAQREARLSRVAPACSAHSDRQVAVRSKKVVKAKPPRQQQQQQPKFSGAGGTGQPASLPAFRAPGRPRAATSARLSPRLLCALPCRQPTGGRQGARQQQDYSRAVPLGAPRPGSCSARLPVPAPTHACHAWPPTPYVPHRPTGLAPGRCTPHPGTRAIRFPPSCPRRARLPATYPLPFLTPSLLALPIHTDGPGVV